MAMSLGIGAAGPIFEGRFVTDAAYQNFLTTRGVTTPADERFVAQVRSGRPGAADYEAGLHVPPNFTNVGPVGTAGQISWVSGVAVPFTLTRMGATVTFQTGTYNQSWTDPMVDDVNLFAFRARADRVGSSTLVDNLVFNGQSLGQKLNPIGANGVEIVVFSAVTGNFTLTGTTTLAWTGALPTGSRLGFQLKAMIDNEVPESKTLLLCGGALAALLVWRRLSSDARCTSDRAGDVCSPG